jgi:hypothetical protein
VQVRIPRTATRRNAGDWAKVLSSVDPKAVCAFGYEGEFLRPGATIDEDKLFLPGTDLRTAIVLESAGSDGKGRGNNRSPCVFILWRYSRATALWTELARASSVDWTWSLDLRPIAIRALAGGIPPVTLDVPAVASRIAWLLDGELAPLKGVDLAVALDLVHGELAARIVAER